MKDLSAVARVSKHWSSVCKDNDLWRDHCSELANTLTKNSCRAYGYFLKPHENNKTYLEHYIVLKRFLSEQFSSGETIKYYEQDSPFFHFFSGYYEVSLAYYLTGQFEQALKIIDKSISEQEKVEEYWDKWSADFVRDETYAPEKEYHLRADIYTALGNYHLAVDSYAKTREGYEKKPMRVTV